MVTMISRYPLRAGSDRDNSSVTRDADPLAFELAQLAILLALGRELAVRPEPPAMVEAEPVGLAVPADGQSLP